jgi:hypothetical protein
MKKRALAKLFVTFGLQSGYLHKQIQVALYQVSIDKYFSRELSENQITLWLLPPPHHHHPRPQVQARVGAAGTIQM